MHPSRCDDDPRVTNTGGRNGTIPGRCMVDEWNPGRRRAVPAPGPAAEPSTSPAGVTCFEGRLCRMKCLSGWPRPLVYRNRRVITLKTIDQLHGRPEGTSER